MDGLKRILRASVTGAMLVCAAAAFGGDPGLGAPSTSAANVKPLVLSPDMKTQFWFGVATENIMPALARQLKLKGEQGLMVSAVLPDSPAQKAGLQPEDLLIEINGRVLTSQDDLFKAANPRPNAKAASNDAVGKSCTLTYLRGGDRATVEITPEKRPASMVVFNTTATGNSQGLKNYVTPSGDGAQVGTGYRMSLNGGDSGNVTEKSIQGLVSQGQTVVLSQDADVAGNVKNTITVGATVYAVDPQHLDALPANLRPLAQKLIDGTPAATTTTTKPAPVAGDQLEQRVKDLEKQNEELEKQVKELLRRDAERGK